MASLNLSTYHAERALGIPALVCYLTATGRPTEAGMVARDMLVRRVNPGRWRRRARRGVEWGRWAPSL